MAVAHSVCMSPRRSFSLICVLLAAGMGACTEPELETYDPAEIIAEAVDREQSLERLDLDGVVTEHDNPNYNVRAQIWANAAGAEVFRTIDITDLEQTVEMPRGAIFVKENFDLDGNPLDYMQVLAKFEEGYNPLGDDWYFALITRDGSVMREGKGADVEFCRDCHSSMGAMTDYVIGLPAEELAP